MKQTKMKRKRRELCPSPILDEAPKRTKVHAQRKFAQGSNVNSPVITPVKEFERLDRSLDLTPEPVELLPIQRPNTEDFLTFLCFRGTPLLPPTLNFFNTASIVDTNGQVHEIKSESPKNGPIDTSVISKGGSGSSDRPFIAFGVRKRADPIVISRQMERKRRHALALQALRRKYQEQKMAKIRAVTISKLSEKPSGRTPPVRSNSVAKIEKIQSVPAKPPVQKSKVISSKHINITQSVSRNINSKMKPKMCLRSFRGRFVQQELPFRPVKKHKIPEKKIEKKSVVKKELNKKTETLANKPENSDKKKSNPPVKQKDERKKQDVAIRVTRSRKIPLKPKLKGKQIIKRRILLPNSTTLIKSRVLRSQTLKSSSNVQVRITRRCPDRKGPSVILEKLPRKLYKIKIDQTVESKTKLKPKTSKNTGTLKEKNVASKIEKTPSSESSKVEVESVKPSKILKGSNRVLRNEGPAVSQSLVENKMKSKETKLVNIVKKDIQKVDKKDKKDDKNKSVEENAVEKPKVQVEVKKEIEKKLVKKINLVSKSTEEKSGEDLKPKEKKETKQIQQEIFEQKEQKLSQRPSRKTKEAAAIYMEILSHKLVNDKKIDDDNVSIDSFPELPNVKRTEQRENELKAKAIITKSGKTVKKDKTKAESTLSSSEKSKGKVADKSETDSQSDSELKKKTAKNTTRKNKGKDESEPSEIDCIKTVTKSQPFNEKNNAAQKLEDDKLKSESDAVKTRSKTTPESKDEIHKTIKKEPKELVKKENKVDSEKVRSEKVRQDKKIIDVKVENKKSNVKKEVTVVKEEEIKVEDVTLEDSSDSNECLANIPKKASKLSLQKTTLVVQKDILDVKTQDNPTIKKPFRLMSDSDDECLANLSRYSDLKKEELKKQTRHSSSKNKQPDLNDSEDSFHVEVKIPRKKQVTRSRSSKMSVTSSRAKSVVCLNAYSDDESEESQISSKKITKNITSTNKKSVGKKESGKVVDNFSDSDEEPLSKFTRSKEEEKTAEKLKEDILRKQKALIESPPQKNKVKKLKHKEKTNENTKDIIEDLGGKKPKRECAKRPSNYLPMFSSSDDEEKFFYGFSLKNEKKNDSNHSSLDFLSKDLGRRFGKEKVNMSNEQIEKWLKDSAMAGNDKKEEDMTFCQEIPTQTSQELSPSLDTEKLRKSLLETKAKGEATPEKKCDDVSKAIYKSPQDRKPIFKKAKSKTAPAVGAFSVNNERSIYAFEEEVETSVSTPFRRPARRPSSTATSKSEDELSKSEEQTKSHFRKPILRNEEQKKSKVEETIKLNSVSPSQKPIQKAGTSRGSLGKSKRSYSDQMDDFKYKVPSSPSASSSSSAKLYKKQNKYKSKQLENCNATKVSDFPCNGPGELVEAPTFYPTEKEFQDPLEYIEKISQTAEQFGVCKIVPPSTFKPECKVSDDMRFTSYNQYVHKMLHRWGPNFKELMAIRKYLQTQNINLNQPPWIGGMEVDLPRLYQTVQNLGGLKEVIEKEKWSKVSDIMRIPKSAQDRVTKLDDIYCKYLLPYDTLSPDEREKLLDEVETEWAKRESKTLLKMQELDNVEPDESDSESDNEVEECITKGRNMALNAFYRIARNTMSMYFKNTTEPTAQEIEQEFWKHVVNRQNHICVHSGSIDSGSWGYGFAVSKNSPFARHSWNLKVLTNNSGSVLRSLGPVMGVTVPTLHVGMVFSACCWYRDPHSLPWIEYLHTGGKKIWYGIPNSVGDLFRKALTKLVPNYCKNQGIWLPSDTVMLPPSLLIESGVSLSRIVQEPGQFIVVFPKAFTSSISTGYVVSESVFFAPPSWLKTAQMTFDLLRKSCEPSMFSLDRLYVSIINDQRTSVDVLKQMIVIVATISSKEKTQRDTIKGLGVTNFEVLPPPEAPNAKRKKKSQDGGDYECEICRMNLFVSMIIEQEDAIYCLDHAIEQIEKKVIQAENCKLLYTYNEEELAGLVAKINRSIEQKLQKKVFNKFSGMPTLLNKQ